jgi:hypothetical protein
MIYQLGNMFSINEAINGVKFFDGVGENTVKRQRSAA